MSTKIIIPFRDRGLDPRRGANLEVVIAWWYAHGFDVQVQSDGLKGDAQFNRHRAYNAAVERFPETQTFVFTEADMLIHPRQIIKGVGMAMDEPGLVVPFTQYRYLADDMTGVLRDAYHDGSDAEVAALFTAEESEPSSVWNLTPESTMDNGRSIGAVNIVSRRTLEITGGFTEATSGNWYDDNIIEEGFAFLTGQPTRFVDGPAVHLYHLPGHSGDHLSEKDRMATAHNKDLLRIMRWNIRNRRRKQVRDLMSVRVTP